MSAAFEELDSRRESVRLRTLLDYAILDSAPESAFDELAALAAELLDMPFAAISFIDAERHWSKAAYGFAASDVPREISMCAAAIESESGLVMRDASENARFRNHPLVVGAPHIRYYAGVPVLAANGERIGTLCVMDRQPRDVGRAGHRALVRCAKLVSSALERRRESIVREAHQRFLTTVVEQLPAMLFVKDAKTREFVLVNRATESMLGMDRRELIGRTDADLFDPAEASGFVAADLAALRSRTTEISEEQLHTPGGRSRVLRTRKVGIYDERGEPRYLLGISEDITAAKHSEALLSHMARHDELTDLPNRSWFEQRVAEEIEQRSAGSAFAVHALDLDRFKHVNESYGYATGDRVLELVATRLRACIGEGDAVARLSGDEFAVLQLDPADEADAREFAERIVLVLARPFDVDGHYVTLGASVGIALARGADDDDDAERLLRNAGLALEVAKSNGRGDCRVFDASIDVDSASHRALQDDLLVAVTEGQLLLHVQPIVRADDGSVSGYEALVRWDHPTRGLLPPGDFIHIAEEVGVIHEIGRYVLDTACALAATWKDGRSISVNLSPLQFRRPGLVAAVGAALSAAGLAPRRLTLEITESMLMDDTASTVAQLEALRALGVRIAIDDFGTGYSSLAYLRSFAVDQIKIDRSFVRDLPGSSDGAAIVRAIIELGRNLGVAVVAEGVEDDAQLQFLRAEGCGLVQGYLTGRPGLPDAADAS